MNMQECNRKATKTAILESAEAWKKAPLHIKTMAGPYIRPLMACLEAIDSELQTLSEAKK